MNAVHVIEGTEYERGWGQRPDGYVAFNSKEAALKYIVDYDKKYNNLPSAPAEFTKYSYVGIKECSAAFEAEVAQKGQKHFFRTPELKA
jgi:hypothetical protein